ncbi:MAG: hypothetical protein AAFQ50_12010, partial [Pseudomonadota bacterium]
MIRILATMAAMATLATSPVWADDDDDGFGLAGILSASNKDDFEPIQLSAGVPLTSAPWVLKSG